MATLRFGLQTWKPKLHVLAFITDNGKERKKSLGFHVPKIENWDKAKQRAKGCDEAIDINAKIARWEAVFQEYVGKIKRGEVLYDFDEISDLMDGTAKVRKTKPTKTMLLSEAAWELFSVKMDTTAEGTYRQYYTVYEDLKAYDAAHRVKTRISDVDKSFYQKFGLWLISERDNINNTANRKISRIITIMDWAFENRLVDTQHYKIRFTFKGNESDAHPPLLPAEIDRMYAVTGFDGAARLVIDAFVFACETGLRISDIRQLHNRHIKMYSDKEGQFKYIDFTQEKTTNANMIPLPRRALEILAKMPKSGHVFDMPTGQYINRVLKQAASHEDVNITRQFEYVYNQGSKTIKNFRRICDEISFHCGRSSFITNALAAGLNPVFVMDNAGHSDLKITMSYSTQEEVNRMKETLKIMNK